MSNVPTPEYDPFEGNPVIDEAEKALRAFEGEPLTRDEGARLLSMWAHNKELTDRERAAVLARFPIQHFGKEAPAEPFTHPADEGR